jgi:hypothetical protein
MATETYPARRLPASAMVRLQPDGGVLVASGTQEIGDGTYTIMTQVVAVEFCRPKSGLGRFQVSAPGSRHDIRGRGQQPEWHSAVSRIVLEGRLN